MLEINYANGVVTLMPHGRKERKRSVKPYRTGNLELVSAVKGFFSTEGFLLIQSHEGETFDLAAQLRAQRGMKFINALHYATAIRSGCTVFVTNDLVIQSDHIIEVISLKALHG